MSFQGPQTILVPDAIVLYNGTLANTNATSAIDTTNYSSLALQITSNSVFSMTFEGSNDGQFWQDLLVYNSTNPVPEDFITAPGIYTIPVSTQYVRFDPEYVSGNLSCVLVGRNTISPAGVDKIALALDKTTGVALSVNVLNPPVLDVNGRQVPSDVVGPFILSSSTASQPITIDTTGYQSIVVQSTTAGIITPTISNDGINYVGILGTPATTGTTTAATIPSAGIYVFPCVARYFRLTGPASAVYAVTYLRQQPYNPTQGIINPPQNLTQIAGAAVSAATAQLGTNIVNYGGTAVVTGGVAGLTGVGGNIAAGVAPTANPVLVAGIDPGGLLRRPLTDIRGRFLHALNTQLGNTTPLISVAGGYQGVDMIPVTDITNFEGQTLIQLVAQMLVEQQITNQYLYELPRLLNTGAIIQDEPAAFRQDPTVFTTP